MVTKNKLRRFRIRNVVMPKPISFLHRRTRRTRYDPPNRA
jgi:hypothetical protein